MVRGILAAALAVLASGAAAQEIYIIRNPEVNEFRFRWTPASGVVVGYQVCIEYAESEDCSATITTEAVVTPIEWRTWFIRVRALGLSGEYGGWSAPSILFNVNPNPADIDLDGGVGINDYNILSREWGNTRQYLRSEDEPAK